MVYGVTLNKLNDLKKTLKFSIGIDHKAFVRVKPQTLLDIVNALETYRAGLKEYSDLEIEMFPDNEKSWSAKKILDKADKTLE